MADMYNKLFTKILDSSIWLESHTTRIVWVTMIAAMDEDGMVRFAAVGNVAGRARVTDEEAAAAIACLEAPDPNSFDQDNEGRRIERVPGGWVVLNATKYRGLVTAAIIKEQTRQRVRRFRLKRNGNAKKRNGNGVKRKTNASVTTSEARAEARARSESDPKEESNTKHTDENAPRTKRADGRFDQWWSSYPKKTGKKAAFRAWQKANPSDAVVEQMLAALGWQRTQPQWVKDGGRFVPNPATYLNEGRWDDEPFHAAPQTRRSVAELIAERAAQKGSR